MTTETTEVKSSATSLEHPPAASSDRTNFVLARQKSRCRDRRESRMFLVDGQLCWNDDTGGTVGSSYPGSKRHSSVGLMFGSSMDLASIGQSIDSGGAGSGSDEAISYRIKWCRDNIIKLKQQPWPMEKKLQMLKASKLFIKQHQGELKQSKQAKDVIAGTSAIFERYWRHFKREFANFLVIITPWEMRIKKIESHFGSVVASYFTFLRWIFWLNLANSLVMVAFVMVPELIENDADLTGMRRGPMGMQQPSSSSSSSPDGEQEQEAPRPEFNPTLGEMWEFEGFLKFSPIFYGYYSNVEISRSGFWRKPLAFLLSAMLTYLFCFFCISRKLSQNTKLSRIGTKDDEYAFCWTVFVGWDFMIGNSETAYNKTSSLVMNLKEGILEEKEQTKDRDWRLILRRILANVLTIMLIGASAYVVTVAVQRSENLPEDANLLQKNELQLVLSGIQFTFPPLFDFIGYMEKYHPRKALSWQLGRILCLDFLNFYTLMFSLFGTVDEKGKQLDEVAGNITLLRKNVTYYNNLFTTTTTTTPNTTPSLVDTLLSSTPTPVAHLTDASIATNGSFLEPNRTSPGDNSDGLNASSMLTSVLLASSTMMPQAATLPTLLATTTTKIDTSTLLTAAPLSTVTMETIGAQTSTAFGTVDWPPMKAPDAFSTTESISPALSESTTVLFGNDDGGDYPDLDQELKVASRPAEQQQPRAKRAASNGRELGPKRTKRRRGSRAKKRKTQVNGRLVANFGGDSKLLARNGQIEREEDSARAFEEMSAGSSSIGATRPAARGQEMDEEELGGGSSYEEEEPLEGRLVVPKAAVSSYPTTTSSIASGRSNAVQAGRPQIGLARPVGDLAAARQRGSRVLLATQSSPSSRLDDDVNEDLIERASLGEPPFMSTTSLPAIQWLSNGYDNAGDKPTSTPMPIANQLGTDYSVLSSSDQFATESSATETTVSREQLQLEGIASEIRAKSPVAPPTAVGENGRVPAMLEADSGVQYVAIPVGSSVAESSTVGSGDKTPIPTTTSCIPLDSTISTVAPALVSTTLPNGTIAMVPPISSGRKGADASVGFNASEVTYADCIEIPAFKHQEILALNESLKEKLQSLCWETAFGQEMVKTVIMDLVITVLSAVTYEFMRACFVRYCNRFFFWDLERGFPGYQDFKLAENVLHLVNNQSTVWMGMFFAPGLPAINTVKLAVIMYIRSWAVLTCTIPHETVFKVSKSNNFYYWILLINLLICILPVAYSVTWIRPSWHCGPFGGECRMYLVVTKLVKSLLPPEANSVFKYLTSPGAVIPILIALILIIYYLASTVSSSKEANKELKAQLKKEKEQESAVPEITSTAATALDPPSSSAAAAAPSANLAPASRASDLLSATTAASAAPSMLNQNALAAGEISKAQAESRPKTLLMPPPI